MAVEIPHTGKEIGPIQPPTGPKGPKGAPLGLSEPSGVPLLDVGRHDAFQLPIPVLCKKSDELNPFIGYGGRELLIPVSPDLAGGFDATSSRRVVFSKETPEAIAESWTNGFTDPRAHSGARFRYLVHGLQDRASDVVQTLFLIAQMRRGQAGDIGENIDLLMEPHRVGDKKLISASVIDQDHRVTFGNAGLILKTPPENVLDAFPEDAGTDFADPDKEIAGSMKNLCTVDELMDQCINGEYNEVRLVGATNAGKVEVAGLWIKADKQGRPLDQETALQLQAIAFRDRIPLVKIEQREKKFPLKDDAPEILKTSTYVGEGEQRKLVETPYAFAINRGGLRYVIAFDKNRFSIVDDERKMRDMTPDEFAYASGIVDAELDPTTREELQGVLDDLETKYEEFHRNRTPKNDEFGEEPERQGHEKQRGLNDQPIDLQEARVLKRMISKGQLKISAPTIKE